MAILPIFIPHAGCPHRCVFCEQHTISGEKNSLLAGAREQIARRINWLRPGDENEAAFYGGTFTALPRATQEKLFTLTDELLAKKIISSVRISTRPDYIDAEKIALLKAHHVNLVELGVQSLDDAVLARAERGHTGAQALAAHALLRAHDLRTGFQLMLGLPGQSYESVLATAGQTAQARPDVARIYPLLVLKNTPLAQAYASGEFAPLALEEAVEQGAAVYKILSAAGIKIIRVGLQADEELCAPGNIVAGPFHPSMGALVRSRILRQEFTPVLQKIFSEENPASHGALFHCPKKTESELRGMRNENIKYWQEIFPGRSFRIASDAEERISVENF